MARWWTVALIAIGVALALAASPASAAPADAPPVGPLPKGPVTRIEVRRGLLYAIVLPRPATGLAWRVRVAGQRVRPLRAGDVLTVDGVAFRAVAVPPGTHRVSFTFHPFSGALAEVLERFGLKGR